METIECKRCGHTRSIGHLTKEMQKQLLDHSMCFNCFVWVKITKRKPIVADGRCYIQDPKGSCESFMINGKRTMLQVVMFGIVPERFKSALPNNATRC